MKKLCNVRFVRYMAFCIRKYGKLSEFILTAGLSIRYPDLVTRITRRGTIMTIKEIHDWISFIGIVIIIRQVNMQLSVLPLWGIVEISFDDHGLPLFCKLIAYFQQLNHLLFRYAAI